MPGDDLDQLDQDRLVELVREAEQALDRERVRSREHAANAARFEADAHAAEQTRRRTGALLDAEAGKVAALLVERASAEQRIGDADNRARAQAQAAADAASDATNLRTVYGELERRHRDLELKLHRAVTLAREIGEL